MGLESYEIIVSERKILGILSFPAPFRNAKRTKEEIKGSKIIQFSEKAKQQ